VQTEFGAVVLVAQFVTVVPEFAMAWQVLPAQSIRASGEGDGTPTTTGTLVTPADANPAVPSTTAAENAASTTVTTAERIIRCNMSPPPPYLVRTTTS
jgi:hypothetical protein